MASDPIDQVLLKKEVQGGPRAPIRSARELAGIMELP